MLRFRKSLAAKALSHLTILCFIAGVVLSNLAMVTTSPATAAGVATQVAVLDFNNNSEVKDAMLGRKAADALAVQLEATGTFEVVSREEMQRAMERLGLSYPLNQFNWVELAKELDLAGVVIGDISTSALTESSAAVLMECQLFDTTIGEYMNGGAGAATVDKPGFTGASDLLMDDVMTEAATHIATQMATYKPAQAQVLMQDASGKISLSAGARQGIEEGMLMVLLRDVWYPDRQELVRENVGRIKIIATDPISATGQAIKAPEGIKARDRAIAIYTPTKTVKAAESKKKKKKHVNWLLGLAIVAGLLSISSSGGADTAEVSDLEAAATSDGYATRLVWDRSSNPYTHPTTAGSYVAGYEIHRSQYRDFNVSAETLVDVIYDGGALTWVDRPNFYGNTVTFTAADDGSYDWSVGDPGDTATISVGSGSNNTYEASFFHTPPSVGTSYYYKVLRVIIRVQQQTSGEEITQTSTVQRGEPTQCGPATPLEPIPLVAPDNQSQGVDLAAFEPEWDAVDGANRYIVQVSTSGEFDSDETWTSSERTEYLSGGTPMTGIYNIEAVFDSLPSDTNLFWRVGARNSNDEVRPISSTGRLEDEGYVWSEVWQFEPAEGPPDPP